jgi:hypothetical protein
LGLSRKERKAKKENEEGIGKGMKRLKERRVDILRFESGGFLSGGWPSQMALNHGGVAREGFDEVMVRREKGFKYEFTVGGCKARKDGPGE